MCVCVCVYVLLLGVASRFCSRQHAASLSSSHLAFSLGFFVCIHVVHPYNSTDTATAWKKSHFILLDQSDLHMIANMSIAFHAFVRLILTSLSVDEILLPRYMNWSTNFRGLPL